SRLVKVDQLLTGCHGCIERDHVLRQDLAARLVGRVIVEPAFHAHIDAGETNSLDEAQHRPDIDVGCDGMSERGRREDRGKGREGAYMANALDQTKTLQRTERQDGIISSGYDTNHDRALAL